MHKNQLQELAQQSGYNLPSYACIREGPDHAPRFKASVTFNGEIFESPGYFVTLRLAEHAAAEVALNSLSSRGTTQSLARIMDESGVCKNLLQETAQRASVPLPVYNARRSGPGHQPVFTCIVEVGCLTFTGEPARTKKQAEKNAALAAWSSLRKSAGRTDNAPIEDGDVTDEQEQSIIARMLSRSYTAAQHAKSSPAALTHDGVLGGAGQYPAGISPALLPSASGPMYTRRGSSSASSTVGQGDDRGARPGPLYKPRHVNASWASRNETGASRRAADAALRMPANGGEPPMLPETLDGCATEIFVRPQGQQPHVRLTQSSPRMGNPPSVDRRGGTSFRPSYQSSAAAGTRSMPSFPTQGLLSQAPPHLPGVGLPGLLPAQTPQQQPYTLNQPTVSQHTNLAIRPGMAYQPRSARTTRDVNWNQQRSGDIAVTNSERKGVELTGVLPEWSDGDAACGWVPDRVRAPSTLGGPARAFPLGVPMVMATGGVTSSGAPSMSSTALRVEEEDAGDANEVDATARLMLNHLCL